MRKLFILTAMGALFATPATAVTQCLALDNTRVCSQIRTANGLSDWEVTCTGNAGSVWVKGIGVCSSYGAASGARATNLTFSSTVNDNKYCWCRMARPAVSSYWVKSIGVFSSYADCASQCANDCISSMQAEANAFRVALFDFASY